MLSDQANELAAGAPGVLPLGGTDYLVAPATDKTGILVRNWVKGRLKTPVQAVAEAVKHLPPAVRAEAMRAAVAQQAGGSEVTEEAAREILLSLDGCRFLAWTHLKPPTNPGLTREQLDALITEDNYLDVFADLDRATGMGDLAKGDAGN
jgi:hypothetical protein